MQQRIGRRSSVDMTYSRRWFHGFTVADNLSLQPSDLTPFSILAPGIPGCQEEAATRSPDSMMSSRRKSGRSTT